MAKYGPKSREKVKRALHERKQGALKSGRSGRRKSASRRPALVRFAHSGRRVKSRKQAIAIGLSEARRAGAKVPRRRRRR